jgi:hypothetical protein
MRLVKFFLQLGRAVQQQTQQPETVRTQQLVWLRKQHKHGWEAAFTTREH